MLYSQQNQQYNEEKQLFITAVMSIISTVIGNTDVRTMALRMFCEKFAKHIIRMFTRGRTTNSNDVKNNNSEGSASFSAQNDNNNNTTTTTNGKNIANQEEVDGSHSSSNNNNRDESNQSSLIHYNVLQQVPDAVLITFLASMSRKDVALHKKSLGALLYYAMHSRLHLFGHPPLDTRQGKLSLVRVNSAHATSTLLNTANPLYATNPNSKSTLSVAIKSGVD